MRYGQGHEEGERIGLKEKLRRGQMTKNAGGNFAIAESVPTSCVRIQIKDNQKGPKQGEGAH